jgi:hypothetical protein
MDGTLNDPLWQKAAVARDFVDSYNGPEVKARTEARFLRDATTLYVGVRCELPDGRCKQTLPPDSTDRWVWEEESVELFLVQDVKKYQFLIGPDNIYADNYHPDLNKPFSMSMFKWDCKDGKHRSQKGEKEWTAAFSIPLASMDLPAPTKEKPWKVNLGRNYFWSEDKGEVKTWQRDLSTWRPTFGSFHNVDRFGAMVFD